MHDDAMTLLSRELAFIRDERRRLDREEQRVRRRINALQAEQNAARWAQMKTNAVEDDDG